MSSHKDYGRLTRARSRRGLGMIAAPRSSLWIGRDHLLKIDSMRFTEEYKRFYFRDIQAITICLNQRRSTWNLILVMVIFFLFATLLSAGFLRLDDDSYWLVGITFSLLALLLLANNFLGPTCEVYLRTAVQVEELPSLSRVRRARNALARLYPLIAAAQGRLEPEELSMRLQEMGGSTEEAS
jgi:hypothetical protein